MMGSLNSSNARLCKIKSCTWHKFHTYMIMCQCVMGLCLVAFWCPFCNFGLQGYFIPHFNMGIMTNAMCVIYSSIHISYIKCSKRTSLFSNIILYILKKKTEKYYIRQGFNTFLIFSTFKQSPHSKIWLTHMNFKKVVERYLYIQMKTFNIM